MEIHIKSYRPKKLFEKPSQEFPANIAESNLSSLQNISPSANIKLLQGVQGALISNMQDTHRIILNIKTLKMCLTIIFNSYTDVCQIKDSGQKIFKWYPDPLLKYILNRTRLYFIRKFLFLRSSRIFPAQYCLYLLHQETLQMLHFFR